MGGRLEEDVTAMVTRLVFMAGHVEQVDVRCYVCRATIQYTRDLHNAESIREGNRKYRDFYDEHRKCYKP